MLSDDVRTQSRNHTARLGGTSATAVALALILAACGSEAENTDTASQPADTGQNQAVSESAASGGETAAETASASKTQAENMMADSTAAAEAGAQTESDGGTEETAAKEKEQKRKPMDGYTVYNRFCQVCHAQGMNGAPKFRNKQAWAPRIEKGKETLYKHSIEGFKAMPPKGGISGLYDQEVKDAVDHMVNNAGGWVSGDE